MPALAGFVPGTIDVVWKSRKKVAKRPGIAAIVINALVILLLVFNGYVHTRTEVNAMMARNNLKQMYLLLSIYQVDYGRYPSLQSNMTASLRSGGVKDLYLLWKSGVMKKEALKLLQPPGIAMLPFSVKPTIQEFDKLHIGYSYNSTAKPDDSSNSPLMAERGVSDGRLDGSEKPVFKDGAQVLFSDGSIEFIPAVKGQLSTCDVSVAQWGNLQD